MFSRDLTVLPAHPTRSSAIGLSHTSEPAFTFSAIAGRPTHLPTPGGWNAELAWVAGYVVRQYTSPKGVTHPAANRAQCSATALMETNALPLD